MNLLKLSWKNILSRPLNTVLSLILFILGVGLISLLLLFNKQLTDKFERNKGGINLVLGAKGSPLQLILSSVYQVDNPTGNIPIAEARPFLNPKHPLIKLAVPLNLGDSYQSFRIVGTTHDYLSVFGGDIGSGEIFEEDFQVTIGYEVARKTGLKPGDEFASVHGFGAAIDTHEDHPYRVASVLKRSNTVLDQLILTNLSSVWESHAGHEEEQVPDSLAHDHAHHGVHTLAHLFEMASEGDDNDITSILIQFKNETDFKSLSMGRAINENTDLMAAYPAYHTARLFEQMGVGDLALRALAVIIVIVSALSVFFSLFSSLKDRKYELAIMRVMGASRSKLFLLVILEGLMVAFIGFLLGIAISHFGMEVLARYLQDAYQYKFTGSLFLKSEFVLLAGALITGFLAAIIPAIQASRTDISETLATY